MGNKVVLDIVRHSIKKCVNQYHRIPVTLTGKSQEVERIANHSSLALLGQL